MRPLNRTLNTSITTLIAIGSIVIFGGPVIRGLSLTLFLGVLIGTWSSIFVASNLLIFISPHPSHEKLHEETSSPASLGYNNPKNSAEER